jgi:pumilio family protein 6
MILFTFLLARFSLLSQEKNVNLLRIFPVVTPLINFHNLLYPKIKPHLLSWATGAGSFIVVGLLEAEGFEHGSDLRKELKEKKSMARLKSAVEDGNKGSSVILEALE